MSFDCSLFVSSGKASRWQERKHCCIRTSNETRKKRNEFGWHKCGDCGPMKENKKSARRTLLAKREATCIGHWQPWQLPTNSTRCLHSGRRLRRQQGVDHLPSCFPAHHKFVQRISRSQSKYIGRWSWRRRWSSSMASPSMASPSMAMGTPRLDEFSGSLH